jgi:peptidoglycan/xylan/chitin deacetylase (PgdA/CDA1 family)
MFLLGILVFFVVPALLALEVARLAYLEFRRDRVPILLYHRLISREDVAAGRTPDTEPIYACYDDTFEQQMKHLHDQGYTALSLDDLKTIRESRAALPAKPVVITFDDGYASNHAMALPVLRRFGQKATVFVALEPDAYTRGRVAGFDGFLDAEQMREMDRSGVAVESHTLTHCILSELDPAAALHELTESKRRLSEILGRPVRHLAVPRSGHSRTVRALVRRAGYETACCNAKGSSNGWSSLLALPRIVIERDMSPGDFARALTPRAALALRLVGNVKRIPALLVGARATQGLRRRLYGGPLAGVFQTRRLKRLLGGCVMLYLLGAIAFAWYLVTR